MNLAGCKRLIPHDDTVDGVAIGTELGKLARTKEVFNVDLLAEA